MTRKRVAILSISASLLAVPAVQAQSADLRQKLSQLKVRHETAHYRLAGTVSEQQLKEYGRALEFIYKEYERGFSKILDSKPAARSASRKASRAALDPPKDDDGGRPRAPRARERAEPNDPDGASITDVSDRERYSVIIFARESEYQEFGSRFLRGQTEHTSGMYLDSLDLLLILNQPNADDTYEVLFHEAFHQFMRRHVADPPMWLNEGLAVHYGHARPGRGGVSFSRPPAQYWQLLRKAVDTRAELPLAEVISANRAEFYDGTPVEIDDYDHVRRSTLFYGQSYTLVHLLLSKKEGRERLQDYIRDLAAAEGRDTRGITEKYFSPKTCEALTQAWVDHLRSRPETR